MSVWQSNCNGIFVIVSFLRWRNGLNVQPKGHGSPGEYFQLLSVGSFDQLGVVWFSSPFDSDLSKSYWLAFML